MLLFAPNKGTIEIVCHLQNGLFWPLFPLLQPPLTPVSFTKRWQNIAWNRKRLFYFLWLFKHTLSLSKEIKKVRNCSSNCTLTLTHRYTNINKLCFESSNMHVSEAQISSWMGLLTVILFELLEITLFTYTRPSSYGFLRSTYYWF